VRVLVAIVMRGDQPTGLSDEFGYLVSGQLLADGHGFINPFAYALDQIEYQSAIHPPLYSMVLSVPSFLGLESTLGFRIFNGLIGAALVFAVGLLGRELGGDRAGLIAAVLAALYPHLWISDTAIMPEALFCLLVVIGMLAAYRYWRNPSWQLAAATSAAFALAALTRSEGVLLVPLIALPLALRSRGLDWNHRLRAAGVVALVAGLLIGPWVVRNLIEFDEPTTMASGTGHVIAYGNCDATYSGDFLGYWHDSCALKEFPEGDESVVNEAAQKQGTDYIKDHMRRQPVVVAARIGRLFDVYRPAQNVEFNRFFERRGDLPSTLALWAYYLLLIPAIWGFVTMRRRGVIIWPILMIVGIAVFTAAITFGVTRYRAPVDALLPVVAGVGVSAWFGRTQPASPADETPSPAPATTGP
jgi:4-amino-4-deoxy-L-arabinose transferase-like glycosyltransferase